jgi:SAM-dependent methyltransferase
LALAPGANVLDVACGNGNTAIPAAKAGALVTGVDLAPYLIAQAVARAENAGVEATFEVGDAEDMPYDDASFDVVITMFGAMFTPRPAVVASELQRVCRPGGYVAMGNWTPTGFIGQMFKTTGKHVQPPAAMPSPLLWGNEETVRERFSPGVSELRMTRRDIDFVFPFGPEETVETFRKYYGPTQKAFAALEGEAQDALRQDLVELWSANNRATDGSTLVSSVYLEVIVKV